MAAEFKKVEKPGRYPSRYTDSYTAKNTCTDNYGALYCKVRTLRLVFAWEAAIAVVRSGGFGCRLEAPWAVPTSLLGRARVPGVGASASRLSRFFRNRRCMKNAWCFLSMFCFV